MGLYTGLRNTLSSSLFHHVDAFNSDCLFETFEEKNRNFLIDVRSPEQVSKLPVVSLPSNTEYINISLDNDDLAEKLHYALSKFDPKDHQIITMCARGYRGTIAYTLFRQILKFPQFSMKVCQSTTD